MGKTVLLTGVAGFIGWKPQVDINEGLEKTVQWYIENKDWIKNISLEENI